MPALVWHFRAALTERQSETSLFAQSRGTWYCLNQGKWQEMKDKEKWRGKEWDETTALYEVQKREGDRGRKRWGTEREQWKGMAMKEGGRGGQREKLLPPWLLLSAVHLWDERQASVVSSSMKTGPQTLLQLSRKLFWRLQRRTENGEEFRDWQEFTSSGAEHNRWETCCFKRTGYKTMWHKRQTAETNL